MRVVAIIAVLFAITACQVTEDEKLVETAKQAMVAELIDPDSAKFRNVRVLTAENGVKQVCGETNGKNRFGGYTGFQPFIFGSGKVMASSMVKDSTQKQRDFHDCVIRVLCDEGRDKSGAAIDACGSPY